jgi:hypothetical protein
MSITAPENRRKAYGPFAFSAAIYAMGVIVFSAWNYNQHRSILLEQIDNTLAKGIIAAEQLIHLERIEKHIKSQSIGAAATVEYQEKFTHLASANDFDVLGIVGYQRGHIQTIAAGIDPHKNIPANSIHSGDPVPPELAAIVQEMARTGKQQIHRKYQPIKNFAPMRLFANYHRITDEYGYAVIAVKNTDSINALLHEQILQKIITGIILLMLAVPLVVLYNRAQNRTSQAMAKLNIRLQEEVESQKNHEKELEDAIRDLGRLNAVSTGRESRIIQLKSEVNTLLEQLNQEKRYNVDHLE